MDEPLSALDAKLRTQMRAEISKLHKKLGTIFVYVTHDQTEAMTLGTWVDVMKDGLIQQTDTPQNLYNHPANMFVAGFVPAQAIALAEPYRASGLTINDTLMIPLIAVAETVGATVVPDETAGTISISYE
jgi:ABC-type sugar transport system ATPase subunit